MEEDEIGNNRQPFRPYTKLLKTLAVERSVEITYVRIPVPDNDVPPVATMRTILDTIDSALMRNESTYVHCWGGLGTPRGTSFTGQLAPSVVEIFHA